MTAITLTAFSGEIPKLLDRMLPGSAAGRCINTRLTDGGLEPIRLPMKVHGFDGAADDATVYYHDGEWLSWPGLVHAAPGPVAQDRLYITGDGAPKMRVDGETYGLAVAAPGAALAGVASGAGDGEVVTRLYVYTHVTEFGEESEPSPISGEIDWEAGQTVTLSGFELGDASRGVDTQRIYRSQTGPSGTQLYFIAERTSSTADFVDDIDLEAIGEPIPSTDYNAPPAELSGLTPLANGMMAGFVGKDLYFCEPYRPHAWPVKYVLTVDYPIVGLGAFADVVVIATQGTPYMASGSAPEAMVMRRLEVNLPCLSPRGVVDLGYAVAYPSHDGLVVVDQGGARLATLNLFSRVDWRRLSPKTMVGGQYSGRYFAAHDYIGTDGQRKVGALIIDLSGEQPFLIRTDIMARSFYHDIASGNLYYLEQGVLYQWDAEEQPRAVQLWRSREFVTPRPVRLGVIRVDAEDAFTDLELAALQAEIAAIEQANLEAYASGDLGGYFGGYVMGTVAYGDDLLETPPQNDQFSVVRVYADGELRATVTAFNRQARLPSGYRARRWQFEVEGNLTLSQVSMATAGNEIGR